MSSQSSLYLKQINKLSGKERDAALEELWSSLGYELIEKYSKYSDLARCELCGMIDTDICLCVVCNKENAVICNDCYSKCKVCLDCGEWISENILIESDSVSVSDEN